MKGIKLHGEWFEAAAFRMPEPPVRLAAIGVPGPVVDFLQEWFGDEGPIAAQTSGSTGPPKQLLLPRDQLIASAQLTALHFDFRAGQKAFLSLGAQFIAGKMMLVRAIVSGLDLYTASPSSRPDQHFPDQSFHFSPLVPAQLYAMLEAGSDIQRFGTILLGGSDLSPQLQQALARLSPAQSVWQGFGMTETASHLALRRLHPEPEQSYTPLPGVLVEVDARACLRVWGPITAYRWLQTNDVVDLQPDGRFRWLGRADHTIVTGGHKVQPEVLEQRLSALATQQPALAPWFQHPFYLSAAPDPQYGQRLVLQLELPENTELPPLDALQTLLRPQLAPHELPRAMERRALFDRTANGKIIRR